MQVTFLSLCSIDLLPYDCLVFDTPWEARHFSLLAAGINVAVVHEVAGQPLGQDEEEYLPFDMQECSAPELADVGGVRLLWNEDSDCSLPL